MTSTQYAPKHKRVLRDGQTPRGPKRWARAYANLLENPTSKAADLTARRISTANGFRDFKEFKRIFEHVEVYRRGPAPEVKRKYLTCNMFCAAMVVQLDIDSTRYADVLGVFQGTYLRTYKWQGVDTISDWQDHVSVMDSSTLVRTVRCQHCGGKISP